MYSVSKYLEEYGGNLPADYVSLPSRGLIYKEDSFFYNKKTIEYKSMTPRQEDILLNSSYRKNETAIEKMVSSCLLEPNIDLSDLLVGDKDILMVAIRISGYGRMFEPTLSCPNCDCQNTIHFDLTTIPIKFLDLKPYVRGENLFEFILPISKNKILFKFLTIKEERELNLLYKKTNTEEYSAVTTLIQNSIVSIDGIEDRNKIKNFVQNMRANDSRNFRKYIEDNKPGLDMNTEFECVECSTIQKISLPTNHKFFSMMPEHREMIFLEPFFLLGYYFGMDYKTYYNLPLSYRKWLIDRIGTEIKKSAEANSKGANEVPSRGAHHNTPDARTLSGKARAHVPAKLRRFT